MRFVERPLAGRRVVTTRERRGLLDSLLARSGADVVHVPMIEIGAPTDGGTDLRTALADLGAIDWVIVTSQHGARAVGAELANHSTISLAAVGARTAEVLSGLAGRPVDVVPERQTADGLLEAMPAGTGHVLVAQADRADGAVADGLTRLGYSARAVTAYCTELRAPSPQERVAASTADAVTFASGSAVSAWFAAFGDDAPPVTVAIGPSTAAVARDAGLAITHIALDHDVEGLAAATIDAFDPVSGDFG